MTESSTETPQAYVLRFLDGPFARQTIQNLPGMFSWPLPKKVMVSGLPGISSLAVRAVPDSDDEFTAPEGAVIYTKVSESQIDPEDAAKMTHVVIGAQYSMEPDRYNGELLDD